MPLRTTIIFLLLLIILVFVFLMDILLGSIQIPIQKIFSVILTNHHDGYSGIIWQFRFPKALTATLVGSSLAVSGLLMQTLFKNPLASPYVLGISSGASLGVALLIMASGASWIPIFMVTSGWGQIFAAIIGALLILMLVLLFSTRINDTVSLLIVGMMFGSITGALVNVLQSITNPDALKIFVIWTMGSLSAVSWEYMYIMFPMLFAGLLISLLLPKQLNALLLGENYAKSIGVTVFRLRFIIILVTCLLAGAATAFTGPIAFIGVAVPHIIRGIFRSSDHRIILPGSILGGAILLLMCDIVSQLPGSEYTLPINSVSAIIGAPIIIWIIFKNKNLYS
ncbi:MAG TPA: iron ABC transporter permease [Paludibacteraceae bacterium]|nr:iron ABC transporter permease [Paludibacteraceae bacterium]